MLTLLSEVNIAALRVPLGYMTCETHNDCGVDNKCMAGWCVDPNYTVEVPEIEDPACESNTDCGKDGNCVAGICLAANKLRFAARAPPDPACYSNHDCWGQGDAPEGICWSGICIAPPNKLARSQTPTDDLGCHSHHDCWGKNGAPDGLCWNGICIAAYKLMNRSPQTQTYPCESNDECWDKELGFGVCSNGLCNFTSDEPYTPLDPICPLGEECYDKEGTLGYCVEGGCTPLPPTKREAPSCITNADCGQNELCAGICIRRADTIETRSLGLTG